MKKLTKLTLFIFIIPIFIVMVSCKNADQYDLVLRISEDEHGSELWEKIIEKYQEKNRKLKISYQIEDLNEAEDKLIFEDNNTPDIIYLSQEKSRSFMNTYIKENKLSDLSKTLDQKISHSKKTLRESFLSDIIETHDSKNLSLPVFFSPAGLFYNRDFFESEQYVLPKSWDEFLLLGAKLELENRIKPQSEKLYLWTFPKASLLDSLSFSIMATHLGKEHYEKVIRYESDIWNPEKENYFIDQIANLKKYLHPKTTEYTLIEDTMKSEELFLTNKTMFIVNNMNFILKNKEQAEEMNLGFLPVPKSKESDEIYSSTDVSRIIVPEKAKHLEKAQDFILFLYSEEAQNIIGKYSKTHFPLPVRECIELFESEKYLEGSYAQMFHQYKETTKPLLGGFDEPRVCINPTIEEALFQSMNLYFANQKTLENWKKEVHDANQKLANPSIS